MGKFVPHSKVANEPWSIWQKDNGKYSAEAVTRAILLDIRSELKKLNSVMQCPNVARGFLALTEMNRRDKKEFNARVKRAVARRLKKAGVKS